MAIWRWRTSTLENRTKVYQRAGNFVVTLIVTDTQSMTGANQISISVVNVLSTTTTSPSTSISHTLTPSPTPTTSLTHTSSTPSTTPTFFFPPTTPSSFSNLALNKMTSASSQFSSNFSAMKATDNDPINTRWCASSGTFPQWLRVDLGNLYSIMGTLVKWESNGIWQVYQKWISR